MFAIDDFGNPSRRANSLGPTGVLPFSARRSRIAAARVTAGASDPPASISSLTTFTAPLYAHELAAASVIVRA